MKTTTEEETKAKQEPTPEIESARYRGWRTLAAVLLCLLGLSAPVRYACSDTVIGINSNPIAIPASGTLGTGSPYPSTIGFGGFNGTITAVRVTLHNFSHAFPDDCDILLVGPGGQSTILMSDCGSSGALNNETITFADSGMPMPDAGQINTDTYRPSNYGGATDIFPPGPAQSFSASMAVFNNTSPNGNWSLFVLDDAVGDIGSIADGWTITIGTTAFQNEGIINIPGFGTLGIANPYPSQVNVIAYPTSIRKVRVRLSNLTHSFPDDIDVLLVGPTGHNAIIMSDVGGDPGISTLTLTLDDDAANSLPDNGPLVTGTFRSTNIGIGAGGDTFPAPAPAPNPAATLSTFNDTNPNGAWNLFIVDDAAGDTGNMVRWNLEFDLFPTVLANISTRLRVETGDNVLIGGFIVSGTQPKRVILRAIGPSLPLAGRLPNPTLELRDQNGALLRANNDWRVGTQGFGSQESEIMATGLAPTNNFESAIVATLPANNAQYTAIVRGFNDATGIGVVEAYDLDRTVDSKFANISTRGLVQTGDNVMIAGTIVTGYTTQRVIVRALGPSLPVPGSLADPSLELRDGNGALLGANDNWQDGQLSDVTATGIAPSNPLDSAIVATLPANGASYTAIVRGVNGATGVALVEVYALN